ncbi:MAG: ferrous iron transport protein A, partial [Ruminiclostridium sp.]|nr:ferrous iron transport protein A [Ruminiclostridium sp.]
MMPLTYADMNGEYTIKKVGGSPETKAHLNDLGFVPGSKVIVVNSLNWNLILKVRDTRVALSGELAQKIM